MSNAAFPDLSSMMFPSGDPFSYPNQPISTLEDGQFKQEPGTFGFNGANGLFFNEPTTSGIPFENFDAPIYGVSYMMQPGGGGPSQMGSAFQSPVEWGGSDVGGDQAAWGAKAHGLPAGMNLNEILGGEEWNAGWMDPNYRQTWLVGGGEFFFLLMNEISTFSGFMDGIQKGMGRGGWGYGAGDISLLHVELELVEMLVMWFIEYHESNEWMVDTVLWALSPRQVLCLPQSWFDLGEGNAASCLRSSLVGQDW
jgi:hypothetical protein